MSLLTHPENHLRGLGWTIITLLWLTVLTWIVGWPQVQGYWLGPPVRDLTLTITSPVVRPGTLLTGYSEFDKVRACPGGVEWTAITDADVRIPLTPARPSTRQPGEDQRWPFAIPIMLPVGSYRLQVVAQYGCAEATYHVMSNRAAFEVVE